MHSTGVIPAVSRFLRAPLTHIFLLIAGILLTLSFLSPALAADGTAKVRMVHLSPDAPDVMVKLDGKRVDALADVAYGDASPYLQIPAGPHEVSVFATSDATEPVLEVEITPEAGSSYTIAGVGLLADGSFGARLFEDDLTQPEDGKTKVRVIHAIPDVGAATVSVEDGPDLFALPGFGNASDYVEVEPDTYTLDVTPAGAKSPAFSVEDLNVAPNTTYTAFAVGEASKDTVGAIITADSEDGRIVAVTGNAPDNRSVESDPLADTSGDLSIPSASIRSSAVEKVAAAADEPEGRSKKTPASSKQSEKSPQAQETDDKVDAASTSPAPTPSTTPPVPVEATSIVPVQNTVVSVPSTVTAQVSVPTESVVQDITANVYAEVSQSSAAVTTDVSVASVSVQDISVEVGEIPTAYVPPVQQNVSQMVAVAGVPVEPPVQSVQAIVNTQAAVINSGARRRFVRGR